MAGFKYTRRSGTFVTEQEKDALISSGDPFEVTGVRKINGKFGEQYILKVSFLDGTTKDMAFSATSGVFTRDDLFDQMIDQKVGPGNTVVCKLVLQGRAKIVEVVEDDQ